jgi:hypothetical protein
VYQARLGGLVTPCRLGDKAYPAHLAAFETMIISTMKYVLIVHFFCIVDANIFFYKLGQS